MFILGPSLKLPNPVDDMLELSFFEFVAVVNTVVDVFIKDVLNAVDFEIYSSKVSFCSVIS